MIPGEVLAAEGSIELNPGAERTTLEVVNRSEERRVGKECLL